MSTTPPPPPPPPPAPAAAGSTPAPAPAPATGSAAPPAPARAASGKAKKSNKTTAKKASGAGTNAKKKTTTARKRKPTKATSAASQQAIANDARTAGAHLSQQQAINLARRTDPLWYRMEDVLPSNLAPNDIKKSGIGEEFQAIESALHSHGKTRADVTPQALACLLEHARRYRYELTMSAKKFADVAGRSEVSKEDLELAAELRHDHPVALSSQLPKLNLLAQQVNRKPLPPIPDSSYSGVKLPPPPHQITARTYDVLSGAITAHKMQTQYPYPAISTKGDASPSSSLAQHGAYGAARGRQIPVKLKTNDAPAPSNAAGGGPTPMDTSGSAESPSLSAGATSSALKSE